MDLTPVMKQLVEQQMAAFKKDDYLRPGMAYNDFLGEYSNLLAQAKEDQTPLAGAGFDMSRMPEYYAYMTMLAQEHSERIVAETERHEAREGFDEKMPQAKNDKKMLMAVGRYIVTRTEDSADKKVYDMVRKGRGDVDTLTDNITMVSFVKKHKDLAKGVKPGGITIDDSYLNQVEANALGLLKLRGEAITSGDDTKSQVDRQRRLMTLCIQARREIKLFAEMAFYDDMDRYNQFYASDTIRQQRKNDKRDQGQSQPSA